MVQNVYYVKKDCFHFANNDALEVFTVRASQKEKGGSCTGITFFTK
jgi:hypothetical protein